MGDLTNTRSKKAPQISDIRMHALCYENEKQRNKKVILKTLIYVMKLHKNGSVTWIPNSGWWLPWGRKEAGEELVQGPCGQDVAWSHVSVFVLFGGIVLSVCLIQDEIK